MGGAAAGLAFVRLYCTVWVHTCGSAGPRTDKMWRGTHCKDIKSIASTYASEREAFVSCDWHQLSQPCWKQGPHVGTLHRLRACPSHRTSLYPFRCSPPAGCRHCRPHAFANSCSPQQISEIENRSVKRYQIERSCNCAWLMRFSHMAS